jgi:preprotein translocase subunit SecG
MDILHTIIIIVHLVAALVIIGLVLLQHGKGADMGASFGSGSAGSLFGASGSANFLSRTTAITATVFFVTSLSMAFLATHKPRAEGGTGVMDGISAPAAPAAPAGKGATPPVPAPAAAPSPAAIPGQEPGKAAAPAGAAAPAAAPSNEPAKINQIPK